jgi:hypothetical protein
MKVRVRDAIPALDNMGVPQSESGAPQSLAGYALLNSASKMKLGQQWKKLSLRKVNFAMAIC